MSGSPLPLWWSLAAQIRSDGPQAGAELVRFTAARGVGTWQGSAPLQLFQGQVMVCQLLGGGHMSAREIVAEDRLAGIGPGPFNLIKDRNGERPCHRGGGVGVSPLSEPCRTLLQLGQPEAATYPKEWV
jgi:hypothetical protein